MMAKDDAQCLGTNSDACTVYSDDLVVPGDPERLLRRLFGVDDHRLRERARSERAIRGVAAVCETLAGAREAEFFGHLEQNRAGETDQPELSADVANRTSDGAGDRDLACGDVVEGSVRLDVDEPRTHGGGGHGERPQLLADRRLDLGEWKSELAAAEVLTG